LATAPTSVSSAPSSDRRVMHRPDCGAAYTSLAPQAVARLPAQRRSPLRLRRQRRRRQTSTTPMARLGPMITAPGVHRPAPQDHRPSRCHRRNPRASPVAGLDRIDQHHDPVAHPDRVRVPRPPATHRPRHARPRLAPPAYQADDPRIEQKEELCVLQASGNSDALSLAMRDEFSICDASNVDGSVKGAIR
jgi:hypothetical protein